MSQDFAMSNCGVRHNLPMTAIT